MKKIIILILICINLNAQNIVSSVDFWSANDKKEEDIYKMRFETAENITMYLGGLSDKHHVFTLNNGVVTIKIKALIFDYLNKHNLPKECK